MKTIIVSLLIFLGFSLYAQDAPKTIPSKIESVKLFFDGAQVNRSSSFQADAGTNKYIIKGLSSYINANSIQAKCPNASILGVEYRYNYLDTEKNTEEIRVLLEKREDINRQIQVQKGFSDVFRKEEAMILQNQSLGGEQNGVKVEELKAAADFFRLRLTEIRQKQTEINNKPNLLNKEYSAYNEQLAQVRSREETVSGEIIVTVSVKTASQLDLGLSYFTGNANWKAIYDLRMNDVTKPLVLVRKADIQQNTGEKWDKVKFILSTGNPSFNNTKPALMPWWLGNQKPYNPVYLTNRSTESGSNGTLKGKVFDKGTQEPVPFANIILEDNGQQLGGTTSDFDGNFTIKPILAGKYNLKITYIGHKSMMVKGIIIYADKITFYDAALEPTAVNLESFEVVDYKVPMISKDMATVGGTIASEEITKMPNRSADAVASTAGGIFSADGERGSVRGQRIEKDVMYIDGVRVRGSNSLPSTSIEEITSISGGVSAQYEGTSQSSGYSYSGNINSRNQYNKKEINDISGIGLELKKIDQSTFEYTIEEPQNLPSNGKKRTVIIEEKKMPAIYEYQCVPKLDKTAYLTAHIASWEDYQLISGDLYLYFEGTYLGKSYLDVNTTSDTLDLSLGRDPNIVIERKKVKDRSSIQFLGNNRKIERSWEINIRNNKRNAVTLIIEDQYPLSNNSDIKVELTNQGNAKIDENKGSLTWKIRLEPAETKKLEFSYQIKAPSSYSLWIE